MTLVNKQIKNTFNSILTLGYTNTPLGTDLTSIKDGVGNASPLNISTNKVSVDNSIIISGNSAIDSKIEIGAGRSGNGYAFVDLISDTTYTDYGTRLIRGPGAAGVTSLMHRGPGNLHIITEEESPIVFLRGVDNPVATIEVSGPLVPSIFSIITREKGDARYTPNSIGNNFITPEFYGAVGDIITDDTAAVQAAFDSGKIVFLNSFYRTTSPIAITLNSARRSLAVYGGGKQQSGFYITHSDVGLDIKLSDASAPIGQFNQDVVFRDFAVVSNGAYAAGTGIKISGQPGIGSSEPAIRFDNIAVKPISTAHYFNIGIRLSNVRNGTISNCDVFGYWGNYTGIGIELAAVGSAAPVHMHITDCNISHYNYGIRILPANVGLTTSDYQGVHLRGNNIIAVNYGILAQNSDNQSDQLMITENHCNFRISGIHVEGWKRVFVTDNFCLAYGTIPASTAHGILLTTTGINSIYGFVSNNCVDFSSPTNASSDERGIRVLQGSGGATRVFLTNNMVISADTQYEVPANNILTTSAVAVIGGVNNYSA